MKRDEGAGYIMYWLWDRLAAELAQVSSTKDSSTRTLLVYKRLSRAIVINRFLKVSQLHFT
jgi:hypothetical protein